MATCTIFKEPEDDGSISAADLKRGQVAEITGAGEYGPACRGLIVKRTSRDSLEAVAGTVYWGEAVAPETWRERGLRVRVLPNGTLLRIDENE